MVDRFLMDYIPRDMRDGEDLLVPHLKTIRALPLDMGGLGIVRYSDVDGEKACLQSRAMTFEFAHDNIKSIQRGFARAWTPFTIGSSRNLITAAEEQQRIHEYTPFDVDVQPLRDQALQFHTIDSQRLYESLVRQQQDAKAAWYLSSRYEGSGKWLMSGMAGSVYYGHYRFQGNEFLEALRLRVLMNPIPSDPELGFRSHCVFCRDVDLRNEPFHALDCNRCNNFFMTARHNNVVEILTKHLTKSGQYENVRNEVPLGPGGIREAQATTEHTLYADITAVKVSTHRTLFFDVCIANPSAVTYRNAVAALSSLHKAGGAARQRETMKVNKYRTLNIDVLPFVVEATGRLGACAEHYLPTIAPNDEQDLPKALLAKIRIIIQRYNSKMISSIRRHMLCDNPPPNGAVG
jgi:hypothetical protein